jgi:DNA-binding XRE family transcriptional regulator
MPHDQQNKPPAWSPAGLSQEELADQAGISLTTVARLERQLQASCRGWTLGRLARALGEPSATITLQHSSDKPEPATCGWES